MADRFFEQAILDSPYDCPKLHWELDPERQPRQKILEERRPASFVTPIPKSKRQRGKVKNTLGRLILGEGQGLSTPSSGTS